MEITSLVKIFVGLVVVLFVLIPFLFYRAKKKKVVEKKKEKKVVEPRKEPESLATLLLVIKNKSSKAPELKDALEKIILYHGHIPKKLGIRAHPEFKIYAEIVMRICRHPNTNKNLILNFDRELEKKNPTYVKEINDFLTKGLDTRGF